MKQNDIICVFSNNLDKKLQKSILKNARNDVYFSFISFYQGISIKFDVIFGFDTYSIKVFSMNYHYNLPCYFYYDYERMVIDLIRPKLLKANFVSLHVKFFGL